MPAIRKASILMPLAMLRSSATRFYNADGLGSITSLGSAAGSLAQTYAFDSFGKQTASTGSSVNPFQYTARESDPETGLYYYRARYYDPLVGRFLSEDPIGFSSSSSDFYLYVGNNPTVYDDPLGRDRQDIGLILGRSGDWTNALVIAGLRHPGTGRKPGNANNVLSFLQMLTWIGVSPRVGTIPYFGCGQQTDFVTGLLNKLHDNWTFSKEEGFLNLPNYDPFYHQRIRASSPNPNDPDVIIDPWLNQYQFVPKGGSPGKQGWTPLPQK